ncbi:flagellar hook-basal body complex protein FliE [bacterium]|nr:flagellar hook-basal body complex protein FliE [FCB group bacterium]MBL7191784.1 flagellar hook-basal body complex protein FliE [bacterium]
MDKITGLSQQYRDIIQGIDNKKPDDKSFKDVINKFISDVDKMQKISDQAVKDYATGEVSDIHQVMVAAEEANLSFQLMMEVRNRLVESYREIMRMQA